MWEDISTLPWISEQAESWAIQIPQVAVRTGKLISKAPINDTSSKEESDRYNCAHIGFKHTQIQFTTPVLRTRHMELMLT